VKPRLGAPRMGERCRVRRAGALLRGRKAMSRNRAAGRVDEQLYASSNSTRRALARALNHLWPGLFFISSLATVAAFAFQAP
jgi:hypothetical protein